MKGQNEELIVVNTTLFFENLLFLIIERHCFHSDAEQIIFEPEM